MIHSERVEAEGKNHRRERERAGSTDREAEKKRKHSNEWEEGQVSVLMWPFSCSIVVFVLTTHKKNSTKLIPAFSITPTLQLLHLPHPAVYGQAVIGILRFP